MVVAAAAAVVTVSEGREATEEGEGTAGIGGVETKAAWLEKCEPPSPRIHFHTSARPSCESVRAKDRPVEPHWLETDDRVERSRPVG